MERRSLWPRQARNAPSSFRRVSSPRYQTSDPISSQTIRWSSQTGRWIDQPAQRPSACLQTNRDACSGTKPQVQPSWIASYLRESSPGLRYEPQMDPEYGRRAERQASTQPLWALPAYRKYELRRRHRRRQTARYGTDAERRGRSRCSEIEKSGPSRAVQWHPDRTRRAGLRPGWGRVLR